MIFPGELVIDERRLIGGELRPDVAEGLSVISRGDIKYSAARSVLIVTPFCPRYDSAGIEFGRRIQKAINRIAAKGRLEYIENP